jgi:hypothetical protein
MDAQEFRRKSARYLACAQQMSDPHDRAALMKLAAYWTQVAERAELSKREEQVPRKAEKPGAVD